MIADDQMQTELDKLPAMLDEMRVAPPIVQPSRFWEHLTELNMEQLSRDGFQDFKRTINANYFQFQLTGIRAPQYRAVMRAWLRHPRFAALRARLAEPFEFAQQSKARSLGIPPHKIYATYLALLWEYVHTHDHYGLLDRLDEPLLGHPLYTEYRGHRVSEDLCNSVLEFTAIATEINAHRPIRNAIELGAGYGRLAWVFTSAIPELRYTIVDIPPALAVAERYLSTLLPDRRIFGFRRFADHAEVADELEDAQLVFLTPNQLSLLPPQGADLFLNVSSLHEMRPDQIAYYFDVIATHCSGYFYSKQWQRSVNELDGLVIAHDDYPLPSHWSVMFDRTCQVQVDFFEALYRLGDPDPAMSR